MQPMYEWWNGGFKLYFKSGEMNLDITHNSGKVNLNITHNSGKVNLSTIQTVEKWL